MKKIFKAAKTRTTDNDEDKKKGETKGKKVKKKWKLRDGSWTTSFSVARADKQDAPNPEEYDPKSGKKSTGKGGVSVTYKK